MNSLWMAVTPDEFEFPVMICDTARELSLVLGVDESNVSYMAKHGGLSRKTFNKERYFVRRVTV